MMVMLYLSILFLILYSMVVAEKSFNESCDVLYRMNNINSDLGSYMYGPMDDTIKESFLFLHNMMNPKDCHYRTYGILDLNPITAGFAAQFQLYAKEWLKLAVVTEYKIPIIFNQRFRYYTESEECKDVKYSSNCLFQPMSSCEDDLIKTGTRVQPTLPSVSSLNETWIPLPFRHLGFPMWWGIVQAMIFRLQPNVYEYILNKNQLMNNNSDSNTTRGFPFCSSIAGLHVRHGDKRVDGFKEHSYEQQHSAIFHSPECIRRENKTCYTSNSSSIPVDPLSELKVFVASDDQNVLNSAINNGHYTVKSEYGVSQRTGNIGMAQTLIRNPSIGYKASLEIISDIFFLSHCSTLIGMAASQIFRMSVGIANATGRLKYAAAVDYDQLDRVAKLSRYYDVIFIETFAIPKYDNR